MLGIVKRRKLHQGGDCSTSVEICPDRAVVDDYRRRREESAEIASIRGPCV
jgi:epoxyqueuosine reductase QueG